ncbi:MAG: secretin N-terminal domain-containing protein [Candidatus Firestonebacteria bacterium]
MIINILVALSILFYVSSVFSAPQKTTPVQTKLIEKTTIEEVIRKVGDLKWTSEADKITLVVPIDGSVRRSVSVSKTPTQLILDLYPAELNTKITTIAVNKGVITQVSLSELKNKPTKTVRVILNLVTLTPYEINDDIGKITLKITTPVSAAKTISPVSKTPTVVTVANTVTATSPKIEKKSLAQVQQPVVAKKSAPVVSKVPKKTTQAVVIAASTKTTTENNTVTKGNGVVTNDTVAKTPEVEPVKESTPVVSGNTEKNSVTKGNGETAKLESETKGNTVSETKGNTVSIIEGNTANIKTETEKQQASENKENSETIAETSINTSKLKVTDVTIKTGKAPIVIIDGLSKDTLNQPITMDLQNADLVTVIKTLIEQSGYNLVISKSITGTISVKLKEVPLEKALALILGMNGYTYSIDESMIRIATSDELLTEQEKTLPTTEIFTLNFTKPSLISSIVTSVLSTKGKIQVDDRTNSLIVVDTPSNLQKVKSLLKKIDTMTPQVMIEAKIVEVNVTSSDKFGINWIMASGQARKTSTVQTGETGAVFPDIASPMGEVPRADTKIQIAPPQTAGSAANLQFGTIAKDLNIVMLLDFLISSNDANLLANPKILTLNNQQATINIAQVYSYISAYNQQTGIPTYATVDAGISLSVTPQINSNNYITIKIAPSVSSVVEIGPPPVIAKRDTNTEVRVKDGETIVIGGLIREDEVVTVNKVPVLGDIPLINFLFKSKTTSKQKRDLMIFITPHLTQ